MQAKD